MSQQLRCPDCGKRIVLDGVPPGPIIMCRACGGRVPVPAELLETAPVSAPASGVVHRPGGHGGSFDQAAPNPGAMTTSRAPRRPALVAAAALASAALIVGGGLVARPLLTHRTTLGVASTASTNPASSEPAKAAPLSAGPATAPTMPASPAASGGPGIAALTSTSPATLPAGASDPSEAQRATTPAAASLVSSPPPREASASPPATPDNSERRPVFTIGPRPAAPAGSMADAEVERSIRRGVDFLLSQFENGSISVRYAGTESRRAGLDALCVYALLEAGRSVRDDRLDPKGPQMKAMLERLKAYRLEPNLNAPFEPLVYAKSLRVAALAVYDRPEDRKVLKDDFTWLVNEEEDGAYSYGGIWSVPKVDRLVGDPSHSYTVSSRVATVHVCHPYRGMTEGDHTYTQYTANRINGGLRRDGIETMAGYFKPPLTVPPTGSYTSWNGGDAGASGAAAPAPAAAAPEPAPAPANPRAGAGGADLTGIGGRTGQPLSVMFPWDNSNSQYGLLGVWSGAEVGLEVPAYYWKDVDNHWARCELKTGEWGYKRGDMRGSQAMTCAGVASLLVTNEYLQPAPVSFPNGAGRQVYPKPLAAGLAWLEAGDNSVNVGASGSHFIGYDLFGVGRVGLASGLKYFGAHDWYRELAQRACAAQWDNGAWGRSQTGEEAVIDSAFVTLFLADGRRPVFMNKLRFDGDWCNRPRDVASLTRFASHNAERALNWQVVTFEHGWADWLDCPVLYLASQRPPALREDDYQKLRGFVEAGGLLFTHADGDSPEFTQWVENTLVPRVCPGYALRPLTDGHPIFHVNYDIPPGAVKLSGAGNGSRLLVVHSPTDLARAWQGRNDRVRVDSFRLGVNLFFYAAGKSDLRNRLVPSVVPDPPTAQSPAMPVARLRYGGNWDPEPYGWQRLARACRWDTGLAVTPVPVDLAALDATTPVAHLTGTAAPAFTAGEVDAVRAYVERGGVLVIDPCGGSGDFAQAVNENLLGKAFPGTDAVDLRADQPLLGRLGNAPGAPGAPRLRPYASDRLRAAPPRLKLLTFGKGAVVLCPVDLSTALTGANTWPILGYEPASATTLMENVLVWAATRGGGGGDASASAAPGTER